MDAKLGSSRSADGDSPTTSSSRANRSGSAARDRRRATVVYRERYGHTPLSADEAFPWSVARLVIGTGASAQLPVLDEVDVEAERRGIEIVATSEACELLMRESGPATAATLHVTC